MAERRMFTKKITDSDTFVELPSSAQALYFHLNQGADDDGFNNQVQNAMFKSHATIDDLKVLMLKNFIIRFENGVIVINHWRLHNTLRKDRYTPTDFQDEIKKLGLKDDGSYTLLDTGCQLVAERLPQDRIGKNSINNTPYNPPKGEEEKKEDYQELFKKFWDAYPRKVSKGNAEKWFKRNKPTKELVDKMISKICLLRTTTQWQKNNGQFIPYPTSWLNAKGWEDEIKTNSNIKVPTKGFEPNKKITFPNGLIGYYDEEGTIHYEN